MALMTYRWRLTTMVGLALAAAGVFAVIQAAHADAPCQGTVQVTDTATGTVAGFVGSQLNSFGEYVVATAPAEALTVEAGSGADLTAVNSSDPTYPDVGAIRGFYTQSPDLSSGSPNYSYLGATAQTSPGARPVNGDNSYSDATGMPEDIESAVWSFGSRNVLTPTWVNSNSTKAPTDLVEIQGVLVLTGDPTALVTELKQSATDVSLQVIPSSGTCRTLVLLGVPKSINARTTSSSGTTAKYTGPTATLNGASASSATIGCKPASGSRFRVGATKVTCTGTDPNASNSPLTASFTVTVKCPAARGALSGDHLGPVALGATRPQARQALAPISPRSQKHEDVFCLGLSASGTTVGYGSAGLLKHVPATQRAELNGRVVWILTSSASYALAGVRAGETITRASKHLRLGKPFTTQGNTWYLFKHRSVTGVLEARHRIVEQIGIADPRLTTTRAMQQSLLSRFS
jgi:hypothetical protein